MTLFGYTVQDLANIAIIATAVAAFVTFGLHFYQLKAQTKAANLQSLYVVMGEIDNAWEKYHLCEAKHQDFYFGQLMSTYEKACYLSNQEIIGKATLGLLRHQIIEVILMLVTDKDLLNQMRSVASSSTTYDEIIKFSKENKRAFREHWDYMREAGLAKD